MAEGKTAFLGPISEALDFFASHGMPCPANYNPADFYIFSLATVPGKEAESREKIKYLCDAYESSEAGERVKAIVRDQSNKRDLTEDDSNPSKKNKSPYKANWFQQFSAVMWRSFLSVLRDPQILLVKGSSAIVRQFFSFFRNLRNLGNLVFISVHFASNCVNLSRPNNGRK